MARAPVRIQVKLFVAIVVTVALLVTIGAIGVRALGQSNARTSRLGALQRKVSIYRQVQSDTALKLYEGASVFSNPDRAALESTLRQLNQSYDFGRLEFVASDEGKLLAQIRTTYDRFVKVMAGGIELERRGRLSAGRELQRTRAKPLADRLQRLTNQLVNRAESDIATLVDQNARAYRASQRLFIVVAAGGIVLAVLLGFVISRSLLGPITQINRRLQQLAAGDFSKRVEVVNRDELGELAANLNRMTEELGRLYHDLETASRHKSEFLANMSHELRTPLNAIIGFSEVMLAQTSGRLNAKQTDYLADIRDSGRHLLLLINDILDLSKVEAGKLALDLGPLSLPAALEAGLTMVRENATRQGVALDLQVGPGVSAVEADELRVKQVIFNLLSNAVKCTPSGGRVVVSASRADDHVEVAVRDTGIGIDPADQARIFEAFQQIGQQEGSGLGLAVARRMVALHGGDLWVESTRGAGSTFTFTLPIRRSAPTNVAAADAAASVHEDLAARPRVLLIASDERSIDVLASYLDGDGFDVRVSRAAAEGLEAARLIRPAAIILDIALPSLSGLDFLTRAKADAVTTDVPVILVSRIDDDGNVSALGPADYLVKPVGRERLLSTMRRIAGDTSTSDGPLKVLVIAEDSLTIELLQTVLGAEGFTAVHASGREQGLRAANAEAPSVVIVDLLTSDMDGFAVAERLSREPSTAHIPLVALIAKPVDRAARERLAAHASRVEGGLDRGELAALVRRLCEGTSPEIDVAGKVVLVVEDNDRNLKLAGDILRADGYRTLEARTAHDGIMLALEHVPDLVLMDIGLPDMDGVTALDRLRREPTTTGIPVLAVTAFAMPEDRERLLAAGFDGYLAKPLSPSELSEKVQHELRANRVSA